MPWLRHLAVLFAFFAAFVRPAPASALTPASPESSVGGFEVAAQLLAGELAAASRGQHQGISAAYDEQTSGYRFAAGGGLQTVHQGFRSFSAFRRAMGPAGPGQAWHHIVEQTPGNLARFGPEAIHNTGNLVRLPHGAGTVHARVSGFYSSIRADITGSTSLTVRQWLSTQSFDAQFAFGQRALQNIASGAW